MNSNDAELVRDIFWDLFRQGYITLGLDDANPNWPHFRLSYHGKSMLNSSQPWRFHDTTSYIQMIKKYVPDIKSESINYLEESSAAFYAGCLLACCVMLGVAAEVEFGRLLEVTMQNASHGLKFRPVAAERFVQKRIVKFRNVLTPLLPSLPQQAREGLEANFDAIQSLLRIARNDAGHPTSTPPEREQVYVYLQLFAPFGKQLANLRTALA